MMTETDIQPVNRLEHLLRRVEQTQVLRNHGRVVQLIGLVIESEGPLVGGRAKSAASNPPGTTARLWPKWWDFAIITSCSCRWGKFTEFIPAAKSSPWAPLCACRSASS